jgi:hypothetical protein
MSRRQSCLLITVCATLKPHKAITTISRPRFKCTVQYLTDVDRILCGRFLSIWIVSSRFKLERLLYILAQTDSDRLKAMQFPALRLSPQRPRQAQTARKAVIKKLAHRCPVAFETQHEQCAANLPANGM